MSIGLSNKELKEIGNAYAIAMGAELINQGRGKKRGGLVNSLKAKPYPPDTVQIEGNYYWRFVNYGVLPASIKKPFAPPRIDGLKQWIADKGIASGDDKIRGIAYAIAHTHAEKGMPLMNRRKDASRMNFLDKALKKHDKQINAVIDRIVDGKVEHILALVRQGKRGGL